jgi:mRNA interferase HicA
MRRRQLVRYLESHGCELIREGAKHTVSANREAGKSSTVPRHAEINDYLAHKACRDLGIAEP